jgi:hypothetical protein
MDIAFSVCSNHGSLCEVRCLLIIPLTRIGDNHMWWLNKTKRRLDKAKQNKTKQNKTNITSGRINSFEPGKKPGKVTLQTLFVVLYWLCGIKQGKEISPAFAGGGTECFWMGRTTPRLTGWSQALLVARPCSLGWSQTTFAARPCNPDGVEKI